MISQEEQFRSAAKAGDINRVKGFLDKGVKVNCADSQGYTALHEAVHGGHATVVTLLLQKEASIEVTDKWGGTPLVYARSLGHYDVVSLLESFPSLQARFRDAAKAGDLEEVKGLLEKGCPINCVDKNGYSALHWAASKGHTDTCILLLEKGANNEIYNVQQDDFVVKIFYRQNGKRALDLARGLLWSHKDVIHLLESWMPFKSDAPPLLSQEELISKSSEAELFYIDGDKGIMLVRTASLIRLLAKEDMTSEDIVSFYWDRESNIFSLIPPEDFKVCLWEELRSTSYAVISYQWKSKWHSIVKFLLRSDQRVLQEFMWIDVFCLNQRDAGRMRTVRRSDDIYYNAKAYHLIEIGSLFRGWVLFELSSVSEAMLPPKIHLTLQDPAVINLVKRFVSSSGFDGCEFTVETDREVVRKKIMDTYGSVANFDQRIIIIVNKIFA